MISTIIIAIIFGGFSVIALVIIRNDHTTEHRARKRAIDEATAPWRALYEDASEIYAASRAAYEETIASLTRELAAREEELARWNTIGAALKLGDLKGGRT